MKRTWLVPVVLLLCAAPAAVQAQFNYTVNSDNTITITGWQEYGGPVGSLLIPTNINDMKVTGIGENAFSRTGLTSVAIGNTVTSIGPFAFEYCASLTNAAIPDSVTSMGVLAFAGAGLTSVMLPNSVTNYGQDAFEECNSLTNITFFGNGATSIGPGQFYHCLSLPNVTIPGSVTSIQDGAFEDCASLTNVLIANGVCSIGQGALEGCTSLTSVTIAGSVTNIGYIAFFNCASLPTLTIPGSVTSIAEEAFLNCTSLTNLYFTGDGPSADSSVFDGDNVTVYYLPATSGWDLFAANTGLSPVLWNPGISTGDASFGVQTNSFGFNITNSANLTVVVEACTNLTSPVWVPLATNTLANGVFYFNEPLQPNSTGRFYGLGLP